jgi:hypothetical protein
MVQGIGAGIGEAIVVLLWLIGIAFVAALAGGVAIGHWLL